MVLTYVWIGLGGIDPDNILIAAIMLVLVGRVSLEGLA